MQGEECRTGCSLNKLVSAEPECKSVYLAASMSACVFVDCARRCPLRSVYMSKFACNLVSWMRWGGMLGEVERGSACASQCTPCLGLMKD